MSTHTLRYFIDDKEQRILNYRVTINRNNKTITGKLGDSLFKFPIINADEDLTITVTVNGQYFTSRTFKASILNRGCTFTCGLLTRVSDLISVAKNTEMSEGDKGWTEYSKRFYIVDHRYTIDIDNYRDVKRMQFLIITPNYDYDGIYILTQKVLQLRDKDGI